MKKNLCVNGEAITSSILLGSESEYGPEYAFDDNVDTLYASESYVSRIKPYCGYKFAYPVRIHEIYLFQATFRWCTKVYVRYSDDGENWEVAELFTNLTHEETLVLSQDYGKHLYWCIYVTTNPVNQNSIYPWCVSDMKMYGYDVSGLIYNTVYDTLYENVQKYGVVYEDAKEDTET